MGSSLRLFQSHWRLEISNAFHSFSDLSFVFIKGQNHLRFLLARFSLCWSFLLFVQFPLFRFFVVRGKFIINVKNFIFSLLLLLWRKPPHVNRLLFLKF